MVEEPAETRRRRGQALEEALKEDLEPYSAEELADRVALLGEEIRRCEAQMGRKAAGRAAADALFKR